MNRAHFDNLTHLFNQFPTIGIRQARRMAQHIVREDSMYARALANAIVQTREHSKRCPKCLCNHEQQNINCSFCDDLERDAHKLTIVEKDIDIVAIEKSGVYDGYYFVFGSLIPIKSPDYVERTPLRQLLNHLKKQSVNDVTIAFALHPDAQHTTEVVSEAICDLKKEGLKVCIPGRGFSSGLELEYADPDTIKYAFERRFDITSFTQ